MRKLFYYLTCIFFGLSCEHKSPPIPPDGNYLVAVNGNWSSAFSNGDLSYDFVLPISYENDSILVKQYKFPLNAFNLSNGSGTHTINIDIGEITLSFSNFFNEVQLDEDLYFSLAGGASHYYSSGNRTNLPFTDPASQPHFVTMSGSYDLNVLEYHTNSMIDTAFSAIVDVLYSGDIIDPKIIVDGNSRPFYKCHSYYYLSRNYYDQMNQQSTSEDVEITWINDSINYHYTGIETNLQTQASDSAIYNYTGEKL